jgi:hypothetical protein
MGLLQHGSGWRSLHQARPERRPTWQSRIGWRLSQRGTCGPYLPPVLSRLKSRETCEAKIARWIAWLVLLGESPVWPSRGENNRRQRDAHRSPSTLRARLNNSSASTSKLRSVDASFNRWAAKRQTASWRCGGGIEIIISRACAKVAMMRPSFKIIGSMSLRDHGMAGKARGGPLRSAEVVSSRATDLPTGDLRIIKYGDRANSGRRAAHTPAANATTRASPRAHILICGSMPVVRPTDGLAGCRASLTGEFFRYLGSIALGEASYRGTTSERSHWAWRSARLRPPDSLSFRSRN